MTHKRTWLALGALLAAIIGGTVWAAEQEKQAPKEQTLPPAYPQAIDTAKPTVCPSAYIDALRDWNRDNMQMRGFSGGAIPPSKTQQIESSDRCAAKEQEKTCCEDKCCETAKEKTCCEDKCYEVAKEKTCCTDGKCCGCCEKSKDKQGITVVPVTPGSSFQVLVTPTTPAMTYEIPVAPPAPSCPAMPPLPVQGCGSSWASTTVPQPTQPMQYTPVSPYVPTAYPVGPPAHPDRVSRRDTAAARSDLRGAGAVQPVEDPSGRRKGPHLPRNAGQRRRRGNPRLLREHGTEDRQRVAQGGRRR